MPEYSADDWYLDHLLRFGRKRRLYDVTMLGIDPTSVSLISTEVSPQGHGPLTEADALTLFTLVVSTIRPGTDTSQATSWIQQNL